MELLCVHGLDYTINFLVVDVYHVVIVFCLDFGIRRKADASGFFSFRAVIV